MKGTEFKKIAEVIGRFASVREKAPFPQDRLIVQAADGVVKVVAVARYGTLIATVNESSEQFRAVIRAREFLNFAKKLTAKQDVDITRATAGWENGINVGDTYFESITKSLPDNIYLPKPESQDGGYVDFTGDSLDELAKLAESMKDYVFDKGRYVRTEVQFVGEIHTGEKTRIRVATYDQYRWASREYTGDYEVFGTLEREFVESLRGIGDCRLRFDPANGQVDLLGGRFRAIGKYNFLSYRVPIDGPRNLAKPDNLAVVDKSQLLKDLRFNEKFDKDSRVWLQYNDGTIKVVPYDKTSHGWSVSANLLKDLLSAVTAKKIGLGLRTGMDSPINMRVPDWTIELAPVGRQKEKSTHTLSTTPPGIYVD